MPSALGRHCFSCPTTKGMRRRLRLTPECQDYASAPLYEQRSGFPHLRVSIHESPSSKSRDPDAKFGVHYQGSASSGGPWKRRARSGYACLVLTGPSVPALTADSIDCEVARLQSCEVSTACAVWLPRECSTHFQCWAGNFRYLARWPDRRYP